MKRGSYRSAAVVLNSLDYGESDRILTFYTLENGKLSGIAKGARRSRKRFVGNLDPLSHIDLMFFHNGSTDFVRVEDARLIDAFAPLKEEIERLPRRRHTLPLPAAA